jgi:two-component system nitrogen regulation sensor histidine kinase NtrY
MISKYLYFNIIFRVLIIIILSSLLSYFVFINQSLRFSFLCLLIIVILTINLISYLNTTNKRVRFFFDSVRNDDSNLHFPVFVKERSMGDLYRSRKFSS